MNDVVLDAQRVSMSFFGTTALDAVDFQVRAGEVHALAGHNGSGKSTLIKVLAGAYKPEPGSLVTIGGEELTLASPHESARLGLRFVHQNLALVDTLSVAENIALGSGYLRRPGGSIDWRLQRRLAREEVTQLGYDIDPRTPVGSLPATERTAVAVARALMRLPGQPEPRLVVLDEVTATMPEVEIQRLMQLIRRLKKRDIAVIYVSHHLEEVLEISDRVTVLRDGVRVLSTTAGTLTVDRLTDEVVGTTQWSDRVREPLALQADPDQPALATLEVRGLGGPTLVDLTFTARPGRIVGIAGITGSGRDEVAELLIGASPRRGSVRLGNADLPPGRPEAAVAAGMALVPANRLIHGVVPVQTIRENMSLSALLKRPRWRRFGQADERRTVADWLQRLEIRGATVDGDIMVLSGGNQQKAVLARCLMVQPKALVLDEPTQGVDVGAAAQIHAIVKDVSRTSSVVVCSSDNYELAELCTEVIVLRRGRVVGHLKGDEVSESTLDRLELAGAAASSIDPDRFAPVAHTKAN
jgi:ribose transport system ATP-binding protein